MELPRGNLTPITFAEKSATDIKAAIITTYEAIADRTLAPGDPVRLLLESVASIIINQRTIIDFAGKQNLLSYAVDIYIDYVAELVGVIRLAAKPAITTIEFTLSTTQASVYTIPAGSQVSGGALVFSTTEDLNIPVGSLTGQVAAECTTAGTEGNDLLPGQIKTLVQPLPFVASAVNVTTSSGGAERETDDSMVERIRLAPSSFSVAGPRDAYIYWSLTANQAIIDVAVSSPTPGVVDVRPLLENGEIPTSDVLDQVNDVLSADDIRPLTDNVQVQAPVASNYNIDVDYYIRSSDAQQAVTIQDNVDAAVNGYLLWQKLRIGRDINPDELNKRMLEAGAKRVIINSPVFTVLDETQVAQEGTVVVNYLGLEDA